MAMCLWKKEISAIVAMSLLVSSQAWAVADLRPSWVGLPASSLRPNNSFLDDIQSNLEEARAEAFERKWFDERKAAQLRQNYETLVRDYEMQKEYGLTNPISEQQYIDKFNQSRRAAINHIRSRQAEQTRNSLNAGAQRGEVSAPVMITGTMASLYFGNPVRLSIDDETRVEAKTDFVSERAQLKLESSFLNGAFDYTSQRAMDESLKQDPNRKEEMYKVSVSRGLPLWNMSSGISYGATSDKVTASLSKPLANNLNCTVDTSRKVGDPTVPAEKSVRFDYNIQF